MSREQIISKIKDLEALIDKIQDRVISISVEAEFDDNEYDESYAKESILYSANHTHEWDIEIAEDETYIDDLGKRKAFYEGIIYGYGAALFWVADNYGEDVVKFFEDEIGHNLEKIKGVS